MRNENKRSKKPAVKKDISTKPLGKKERNLPAGSGLIGEHDVSSAAERKIGRTPHDKTSVTGSDTDGQTE